MELNHTCVSLLKILYNCQDYVPINKLAEQMGKTERSVRYDLDLLDKFFQQNSLPPLSRRFGAGIYLEHTPGLEVLLQGFLSTTTPYQYKYSTQERCLYIKMALLTGIVPYISVPELAKRLIVSYPTVIGDLEVVERQLEAQSISLVRRTRVGLRAEGDEETILGVCLQTLNDHISLAEFDRYLYSKPLERKISTLLLEDLFRNLDVNLFRDIPKHAESILNRIFSDEAFGKLIFCLALLTQRARSGTITPIRIAHGKDTLMMTQEYKAAGMMMELLSQQYEVSFPAGVQYYLTAQLLCSKSIVSGQGRLGRDQTRSSRLDRVTEEVVDNIQRLYQIDFGPTRTELVEHLKAHLIPTIYRIRYHRSIVNPLYEDLVAKHGQLLRNTAEAVKPLEQCCDGPISDQEISYIALYFLAAINQRDPQVIRPARVVIACGSGYGTAQVVVSQMKSLFNVEIADILSGRDVCEKIKQGSLHCDYIISTVDLPQLPSELYIRVNPIFTRQDYRNILQFIDARQANHSSDRYMELTEQLVRIAQGHGANRNIEQLRYDILSLLLHDTRIQKPFPQKDSIWDLKDLLLPGLMRIDVPCRNWQEAVYQSTQALELEGYVTEAYKHAIVRNLQEFGPAMVMFPGVLIAHASPADGCRKLGFGFMSLRSPVSFGNKSNDPVKLVFTLSVVDSSSHMEAMIQLFNMISEKPVRETLFRARTKQDVLSILQKEEKNAGAPIGTTEDFTIGGVDLGKS